MLLCIHMFSGSHYVLCSCSLYNNIKPPSWLGPGTDFHLFKEGIEPKWEDPTCESGGKWTVLVPKGPNAKQVLDTYWLNAVSSPTPQKASAYLHAESVYVLYIRPAFWHQEESRNLLANDGMSKGAVAPAAASLHRGAVLRGRGDLWSGGQCASKAGQALHMDKVSKQ